MYAVCILEEDSKSGVKGIVKFYQDSEDKPTKVLAKISGLKAGKHGIHIHQFGNLTKGCKSAGGHFNPFGMSHGGPLDKERHIGDMGNIISNGRNESTLAYDDPLINLFDKNSIFGRSVVVHADEDDLGKGSFIDSKTTGHAGDRLACGVIGISSDLDMEIPVIKHFWENFQKCWKR